VPDKRLRIDGYQLTYHPEGINPINKRLLLKYGISDFTITAQTKFPLYVVCRCIHASR
jgi:hypothetical protein